MNLAIDSRRVAKRDNEEMRHNVISVSSLVYVPEASGCHGNKSSCKAKYTCIVPLVEYERIQ